MTRKPAKKSTTYSLRTIYGNSTRNTSKRVNLTKDLLSSATNGSTTNFTFYWIAGGTTFDLHYMLQSVNGGNSYVDSEEYRQRVTAESGTDWNAKDIAGFTEQGDGQKDQSNGTDGDRDVYFYYLRNKYNITFKNGSNADIVREGIYYQADISSYEITAFHDGKSEVTY